MHLHHVKVPGSFEGLHEKGNISIRCYIVMSHKPFPSPRNTLQRLWICVQHKTLASVSFLPKTKRDFVCFVYHFDEICIPLADRCMYIYVLRSIKLN